jgi:hypothetical protein
MSIRNMDADMASNKLNELFHLHRYEDCVLFINRLSHLTVKIVISQISIDVFLARLPYTIGIFEAFYAKLFIMDPENFPTRTLQPDRLLDKMIVYFSLMSNNLQTNDNDPLMNAQTLPPIEPIDGLKMLESFENCIRIISYIQPNLYSRLLYFKYAIDKGILRLERDLVQYNHQLNGSNNYNSYYNDTGSSNNNNTLNSKRLLNVNDAAVFASRNANMQTCESMKNELQKTQINCEKALIRLNDHISQLKTQKIFKDAQQFFKEAAAAAATTTSSNSKQSAKSPKVKKKKSFKEEPTPSPITKQIANRNDLIFSSTMCQSFVQHRLYLNKSMLNTIEPFLECIKLQQLMASLSERIDSDKEILLVFTYIKREEKYLSVQEPLLPLFKRYSLGFERCIQIWRRKCSADSLLLFNNTTPLNNDSTKTPTSNIKDFTLPRDRNSGINHRSTSFDQSLKKRPTITNRFSYRNFNLPGLVNQFEQLQQFDKLYVLNNDESDQIDRNQGCYESIGSFSNFNINNTNNTTNTLNRNRNTALSLD